MFRPLLLLLVALAASSAHAQWTDSERRGIADLLFLANLKPEEVGRTARPAPGSFRLDLADRFVGQPLSGAESLMEAHAATGDGWLKTLQRAGGWASPLLALRPEPVGEIGLPPDLPAPLRDPIAALIAAIAQAGIRIRSATAQLSPEERRELIELLPQWAAGPHTRFDFVALPRFSRARAMHLLERVDRPLILAAGLDLAKHVDEQLPRLLSASKAAKTQATWRFTAAKIKCVIAGHGPDRHDSKDAMLVVDLGGHDEYRGRHGAGAGYASVLLDLGGDDRYEVPDLGLGAAVLGIGIGVDWEGNDVVRSGSLALGAAIAGVGVWVDGGGDDAFRSAALAQGFGLAGVGLMADSSGSDGYTLERLGQGAARQGGVGWLADRRGDDVYRAQPAQDRDPSSTGAQGFAEGDPEDGGVNGGIGLLSDLGGRDLYSASGWAQACGLAGLGSLYDGAGRDGYLLDGHGQSFADRGGAAALFDLEGNDFYACGSGPGQGRGHSGGVALLLDRRGDDLYSAREGRPGYATFGGVAVFLDSEGEDRYSGPPGVAHGNRPDGSLALFGDWNGPDRYAEGLEDGQADGRLPGGWSHDAPSRPTLGPDPRPDPPSPGSLPDPGPDALARLFEEAAAPIGVPAGERALSASDRLIGIGMPALNWAIAHLFELAEERHVRVLARLAGALGQDGRDRVALRVADRNDAVARIALKVAFAGEFREAGAVIVQALERPVLRSMAARAAGSFGNRAAVPTLMLLCAQKDVSLVADCLASLAELGDPQAVGTAQAFLDHADYRLRQAALAVVVQAPMAALTSGRVFLRDSDERKARIGCEILESLSAPEAIQELVAALGDVRPGVRLQAAWALEGRCPPEHRGKLIALRRDPHPMVRAAAARIDPGR